MVTQTHKQARQTGQTRLTPAAFTGGLRIVAVMPVYTAEGLAAKQRVIERAEFSPDVMEIISEVLRQDFQRATG